MHKKAKNHQNRVINCLEEILEGFSRTKKMQKSEGI